jgi:putative Mn2+ efflux pump MntP
VLKLILFVLPLGLDTFAVSAALGTHRPSSRDRLRVILVMTTFEAAMPLVGLLLGHALVRLIGSGGDYLAIAVLLAIGAWMILADEDDEEKTDRLIGGGTLVLVAIGISISLDELAIGVSIGLSHVSIWLAILLIGLQAFVAAQLGLRLGDRLSEHARERAEQLAGGALIALAALIGAEKAF